MNYGEEPGKYDTRGCFLVTWGLKGTMKIISHQCSILREIRIPEGVIRVTCLIQIKVGMTNIEQ